MERPHPIMLGRNERMRYSKVEEVLEMPNLIEVKKKSYDWFRKGFERGTP